MTAAERLKYLSGLAGVSAAAMLLTLGSGATAGDILRDYSQLPSGTAAQHILVDHVAQETTYPVSDVDRRLVVSNLWASADAGVDVLPVTANTCQAVFAERHETPVTANLVVPEYSDILVEGLIVNIDRPLTLSALDSSAASDRDVDTVVGGRQ